MIPIRQLMIVLVVTALGSTPVLGGVQVQHRGAIKRLMHDGNLSAVVDVDSLSQTAHLYAIGALENLLGEIQIIDSKPLISSVEKGKLHLDTSFSHMAALLVYAEVPNWQQVAVFDSSVTTDSLEVAVADFAARDSIDLEQPFPFLLRGRVVSANWHVINWPAGDTVHSHAKHKSSGLHGTLKEQNATILGFYSRHHHGVFTHQGTNIHIHVISDDGKVAAHLDGAVLAPGMTLWFPGKTGSD